MTEPIDWSKPIEARRAPSLMGGTDGFISTFDGIRDEQIRRASALVAAAGGPKLTKATVRRTVERLAKLVPGLRYKSGMVIFNGLAPITSVFGDDLPGKEAGRPGLWSADRRQQLAAQVAAIQAERAGMSPSDALRELRARLSADRKYPPSLKTLQNQLSQARATSRKSAPGY